MSLHKQLLLWRHWFGMVTGRSYWHLPQPLGRAFDPSGLMGYYNDLTRKTHFPGPTDPQGIPLVTSHVRSQFYHPITIAHKALGHWDSALLEEGDTKAHHREFEKLARKLLAMQDRSGGWPLAEALGIELASPYSAMAQGEAASVFVRAWKHTDETVFRTGAKDALILMLQPIRDGGTARFENNDLVLEEYCWTPSNTILNGWIYGLYGLHDYLLVLDDPVMRRALDLTLASLARWLPRFDNGYWSNYDTIGNVASPFYHTLHIAQLRALEITFPAYSPTFQIHREKYCRYASKRSHQWRAFSHKAWQKLTHPPKAVAG